MKVENLVRYSVAAGRLEMNFKAMRESPFKTDSKTNM